MSCAVAVYHVHKDNSLLGADLHLCLWRRGQPPNKRHDTVVVPTGCPDVAKSDHAILVDNERGRNTATLELVRRIAEEIPWLEQKARNDGGR